jgi:hypothetical protein
VNLAGRGGGEGFRAGVDSDVEAEGSDPGGPGYPPAVGGELAVLLGFEGHRGHLLTCLIGDLGPGDGFMDQPAVGDQAAAGPGIAEGEVRDLAVAQAQGQGGATVVLPTSDVDAAEGADLTQAQQRVFQQQVELVIVTDREAEARQGRTHRITFRCMSSPAATGLWPATNRRR